MKTIIKLLISKLSIKDIFYVVLIIVIVIALKHFGIFNNDKIDPLKPPITPGNVTVITKPTTDSNEVLENIQSMIDWLEKKKKNG